MSPAVERELCRAVAGEPLVPVDPAAFVEAALNEGVAPLVLSRGDLSRVDADARLREEVRRQLGLSAVRDVELRRVIAALHDAGADALVIKGAHLAHALYGEAALRPRHDTDLLVRAEHQAVAVATLERLGYVRCPEITGEAVHGQSMFELPGRPASVLDVHWRLASPLLAANLFDFERLWGAATSLPQLGSAARVPRIIDALAIAAVHQAAHHAGDHRLIWRYDIHLLLNAMDDRLVAELVTEARQRGMTALCAAAVRASQAAFPSATGAAVLAALGNPQAEPSAALLLPRSPSAQAWMDVRALNGWRARATYLAGHLFPPAAYMRTTYAPASAAPLAWLYARRIVTGARKWL